MDIDAAIKDIVSKILYNNRPIHHEAINIYNEQVEKFLNRSHDIKTFDFGRAWIVEKPKQSTSKAKSWVEAIEAELLFTLKNKGLTT